MITLCQLFTSSSTETKCSRRLKKRNHLNSGHKGVYYLNGLFCRCMVRITTWHLNYSDLQPFRPPFKYHNFVSAICYIDHNSNKISIVDWTDYYHLNTRLIHYSDPHCIGAHCKPPLMGHQFVTSSV